MRIDKNDWDLIKERLDGYCYQWKVNPAHFDALSKYQILIRLFR